jgi:hypothetical protein
MRASQSGKINFLQDTAYYANALKHQNFTKRYFYPREVGLTGLRLSEFDGMSKFD